MSLWKREREREREIERDRQTENLEREGERIASWYEQVRTVGTEYLYNYSYILFTLIKYDDKIILIK